MTNWDEVAGDSAAKTDAELAAGIEKLMAADIGKLFPAPADAAKVRALIQTIRVKTAYNERAAAFKAVAATLGGDLLAVVKKAMLGLAVLFLLASGVQAQEVAVSGINIKDVLENTRVGVWLPLEGGRSFKTVYAPLIWFHGEDGTEYAAFDVGGAAPGELTKGYAFVALGFRVDNLLDKALKISPWFKKHISSATLPTIEAGCGPILYDSKVRFGASLALKF